MIYLTLEIYSKMTVGQPIGLSDRRPVGQTDFYLSGAEVVHVSGRGDLRPPARPLGSLALLLLRGLALLLLHLVDDPAPEPGGRGAGGRVELLGLGGGKLITAVSSTFLNF